MDYKTAGVDIEAGNLFVDQIKDTVKSTHRPEVLGGFGGFNGMMRVPSGYEKPVLVSGADGVGTKVHIAELEATGNPSVMRGIGIDLVAMCVNDVITCGAKPLYFLDYICTSDLKLYGDFVKHLVDGIAEGCKISGCSLLGGETAEHPRRSGMVDPIRDMAGFCTGIVEENEIIDGSLIRESDVVIGIESSGLHSNGYSLIREMLWRHKIFLRKGYDEKWGGGKIEDPSPTPELLNPTIIYAPVVASLIKDFPIMGMAHITGGGIPENLPRCLPDGCEARVDYNSWPMPELFSKIMLAGEIPEEEMKKTFNMGIGYCVVVPANVAEDVQLRIEGHGLKSWVIGDITAI
jgi:phosphoribosylformylglycinamidine cyclo-ligase